MLKKAGKNLQPMSRNYTAASTLVNPEASPASSVKDLSKEQFLPLFIMFRQARTTFSKPNNSIKNKTTDYDVTQRSHKLKHSESRILSI